MSGIRHRVLVHNSHLFGIAPSGSFLPVPHCSAGSGLASSIMWDKLRKVNPPAKQPRPLGVAPNGYNAALDLSHTALRAESEGERYTGVLHRPTLAFALRV